MNLISIFVSIILMISFVPNKRITKVIENMELKMVEVKNEVEKDVEGVVNVTYLTYPEFGSKLKSGYIKENVVINNNSYITVEENTIVYSDKELTKEIGEVYPGGWLWNIEKVTEITEEIKVEKVIDKVTTKVKEVVDVTLGLMLVALDFNKKGTITNEEEVNSEQTEKTPKVKRMCLFQLAYIWLKNKYKNFNLRYRLAFYKYKAKDKLSKLKMKVMDKVNAYKKKVSDLLCKLSLLKERVKKEEKLVSNETLKETNDFTNEDNNKEELKEELVSNETLKETDDSSNNINNEDKEDKGIVSDETSEETKLSNAPKNKSKKKKNRHKKGNKKAKDVSNDKKVDNSKDKKDDSEVAINLEEDEVQIKAILENLEKEPVEEISYKDEETYEIPEGVIEKVQNLMVETEEETKEKMDFFESNQKIINLSKKYYNLLIAGVYILGFKMFRYAVNITDEETIIKLCKEAVRRCEANMV